MGQRISIISHNARPMRYPVKSDKFKTNKWNYFFHTYIKLEFTDADAMNAYKVQVSSRKSLINSWNKVPLKAMMNMIKHKLLGAKTDCYEKWTGL